MAFAIDAFDFKTIAKYFPFGTTATKTTKFKSNIVSYL